MSTHSPSPTARQTTPCSVCRRLSKYFVCAAQDRLGDDPYRSPGELAYALDSTRKVANIRHNARIAAVVGWNHDVTVQCEGVADEPRGAELDRLKHAYFSVYPDGTEREHWKGIVYVRMRLTWARYSDFRPNGEVVEFTARDFL